METPRDRQATFDPKIVAKGQTRWTGFDDKIISMYARGMTTREIQGHLEEIYGSVSSQTSATARRSGVQAQIKTSAATSAATRVSSKTGKVASASPLGSGTTIQAELVKPVDAKTSKVGDEVIATTTQDVTAGEIFIDKISPYFARCV